MQINATVLIIGVTDEFGCRVIHSGCAKTSDKQEITSHFTDRNESVSIYSVRFVHNQADNE